MLLISIKHNLINYGSVCNFLQHELAYFNMMRFELLSAPSLPSSCAKSAMKIVHIYILEMLTNFHNL